MDKQQIFNIALKSFLQTGEKLLTNPDDSRLAFEFLDNSNKIRKYIFENHYHNSILRAYYNDLPKVETELSGKVEETILEKIANSSQRTITLVELFGITLSPNREKKRDELMQLVSGINLKTRAVLEQINNMI